MTSTTRPDATGPAHRALDLDALCRRRPTVLSVWAHPDDESYLSGGLMAAVAAAGGRVVAVCATSGESGQDPAGRDQGELASHRGDELRQALGTLGVGELVQLGQADGGCAGVHPLVGARLIAEVLEDVVPDLVVSFGPDGVTGHPDHRAVAAWTATAVAARHHQVPLLAATPRWLGDAALAGLRALGAFEPGFPRQVATPDDVALDLDDDLLARKEAALACHGSQTAVVREALGPAYREMNRREGFRAANDAARAMLAARPEAVAP